MIGYIHQIPITEGAHTDNIYQLLSKLHLTDRIKNDLSETSIAII